MLKVAKFGGSSMADAKQFEKVRDIVRADPARKVIVVSAAGKRSADDHKLTDLLYLCYAHLQYGVNCDAVFQMICDRYIAIRDECGLHVDIEAELAVLRRQMRAGISEEELVFPRRQRHHRRARGRGARCRRVRKLDGRVRHPYGRPPHRARPAAHRAHHL